MAESSSKVTPAGSDAVPPPPPPVSPPPPPPPPPPSASIAPFAPHTPEPVTDAEPEPDAPPPPPPPPAPLPPEPTPLGIPRPSRARRIRAQVLELGLYVLLGIVLFLPGLVFLANDSTIVGVVLIALAMAAVIAISIRRNSVSNE